MWRLRPEVLLAAAWAMLSIRIVKRRLRRDGIRAASPRAPKLPGKARLGVQAVISRLEPNCIERALILQAWLVAHGEHRDVIVGAPIKGMESDTAHAWLEGTEQDNAAKYIELLRLPPRT
jgi:hypothetical protein